MSGDVSFYGDRVGGGRKAWIDAARGYAMLAIYLFHTETYYAGGTVIDYGLYVDNALSCFFVISGYLFCSPGSDVSLRRKLRSVARGIVLPYFVFTLLLALPKHLFHGSGESAADVLLTIVKGQASWFVAALAVAEVMFALMMQLPSAVRRVAVPVICVAGYVASYFLTFEVMFVWYACVALMSLIFIYAGMLYRTFERRIDAAMRPAVFAACAALLVALKWYEWRMGWEMIYGPYCGDSAAVFLVDNIIASLLILSLAKRFDGLRLVNLVGRNSLVWYFFAGASPALSATLFGLAGLPYAGRYFMVLPVMAAACCMSAAGTAVVNRVKRRLKRAGRVGDA